jgi:hypothetical protein
VKELVDQLANKLPAAINNLPPIPGATAGTPSYGATGGLVTPQGIQRLAGGGRVLPFYAARGTDTVPAMLTPGEQVLSVSEVKHARAGGAPMVVQIYQDGRKTAEAIVPYLPGAVARIVGR